MKKTENNSNRVLKNQNAAPRTFTRTKIIMYQNKMPPKRNRGDYFSFFV